MYSGDIFGWLLLDAVVEVIQWIMRQKLRQFCSRCLEIFRNLLCVFDVLEMNFQCLALLKVVVYLCQDEPYLVLLYFGLD